MCQLFSEKIIKGLVSKEAKVYKEKHSQDAPKHGVVQSHISKCKTKNESPAQCEAKAIQDDDSFLLFVSQIYAEYEDALRKENALDFDDLLLYA